MSGSDPLWLPARAKLNLGLRVVGRRADGYHLLDTVFHALELHDDVVLALAPVGIALVVGADEPRWAVPAGPDNLVERALVRFAAAAGYRGGFRAELHKRIPHGAGLGGGSSDASAALRLANALLGAPLPAAELAGVALELGADVPFFLTGGSQRGEGIGERLAPVAVAPSHFVLVVPPFGCATADVYKSFAAAWKSGGDADTVRPIPVPHPPDALSRMGFTNDLQAAAERVRPELAALRHDVETLGQREVGMTGSGSTLFLQYADAEQAHAGAEALAPLAASGVRVLVTRSAPEGVDEPRAWHGCARGDRR